MKGNQTAKKVLGFIFFRSAFTQRNITSIGLVILFFVVYVLAGGKIDAIPKIQTDPGTFGGVDSSLQSKTKQTALPGRNIAQDSDADEEDSLNHLSGKKLDSGSSREEPTSTNIKKDSGDEDPFQSIEKRLQERKKK